MSSIRIIKGYPISLLVEADQSNTSIDLNDGSWATTVELRWQTDKGPKPFEIVSTPTGNGHVIDLTTEQTNQLKTSGTGYVIVIRLNKDNGEVILKNTIPVRVTDDL